MKLHYSDYYVMTPMSAAAVRDGCNTEGCFRYHSAWTLMYVHHQNMDETRDHSAKEGETVMHAWFQGAEEEEGCTCE